MAGADARKHTVPASTDHPQRADLLTLSLTIRDLTVVADTTARTAYIAALAAASPAQTVSTSNPAFVFRTDALALEWSTDGTVWYTVASRTPLTYVPVWGGSVTNPTLGNGTIVGNYQVDDDYIDFDLTLTVGSTTSVGSGNYTLTVPVNPVAGRHMFTGSLLDLSSGLLYSVNGQVIGGGVTMNLYNGGFPVGNLTAAAPVVPASGDIYRYAGRYRWV